jgi:hypothetical protein
MFLVIAASCAALLFAGTAYAGTPGEDAYSGLAGQQLQGPGGAAPTTGVEATGSTGGGTLPFTGLQLSLMLAAGAGLIGTGLAVRRVVRSQQHAV